MFTRLALVACFGPHEGPWLRARGNETGVRITCLGDGEHIIMRHQNGTAEVIEQMLSGEGVFPLPSGFRRISFCKVGGTKPTTVELVVG